MFDGPTANDLFDHPGSDTRQWVSYGVVDATSSDDETAQDVVEFTDDYGPLVSVMLQPSGIPVRCRVAQQAAGDGEGEWHPIIAGDEVLVVIPDGDETSGCVIIGRLSNSRSKFPTLVAGSDARKNNTVFRRTRTPYIHEVAGGHITRHATTGAFYGFDDKGNLTFANGDKSGFFMRADFVGLQSPDASVLIQLNLADKQILLEANGSRFIVDGDASTFITSGVLTLATSGELSHGHAVTLEQLMSILANFLAALAAGAAFAPGWAAAITPTIIDGILSLTLAGTIIPSPYSVPGLGGGVMGPLPLTFAPVLGAIAVGLASPLPSKDVTGLFPGAGKPGLLF